MSLAKAVRASALAAMLVVVGSTLVLPLTPVSAASGTTLVALLGPAPGVATAARGWAIFQISPDGNSISYILFVSGLSNTFMAHIHLKSTGDILVWLYPNPNKVAAGGEAGCIKILSGGPPSACPGLIRGSFKGVLATGTLSAKDLTGSNLCNACTGISMSALVSDMETGRTFVNVHTLQNPGGEIQGLVI